MKSISDILGKLRSGILPEHSRSPRKRAEDSIGVADSMSSHKISGVKIIRNTAESNFENNVGWTNSCYYVSSLS